jgi:hypothetical protein
MKALVTGAASFICGYLIDEMVGVDNFIKHGQVAKEL